MNLQDLTMRVLRQAGSGATLRVSRYDGRGHAARKIYSVFDANGERVPYFETTATTVLRLFRRRLIQSANQDIFTLGEVS